VLQPSVQYPPGWIISIDALRGLDMLVLIGCVQIVRTQNELDGYRDYARRVR
jgi:hypothetical protein